MFVKFIICNWEFFIAQTSLWYLHQFPFINLKVLIVDVLKTKTARLKIVVELYCEIEIPQESILGPILFLIFVNYISNCINLPLTLYADDINLCLVFCYATSEMDDQYNNFLHHIKE